MSEPATQTDLEWEFADNQEFLFQPMRTKVGHGGRGGTKSWGFARALLVQGFQQPLRILCAREVQRSIKDSVHQLLADQIQLLGLGAFYQVLQNEIRGRNGTTFIFSGLSNLTAESIKSYEGVDRCWVEEAAAVTRRSWDILIPTIRKPDSEIWVSFNPELDTDETWLRFVENQPDDCHVEVMSYDTNPWFPNVLEKERIEFLRQVESGARDKEDYDNIWGGQCKTAVDGAIYPKQTQLVKTEGRLCHVPHDPLLFTHLVWDLGYNDNMSIGFIQKSGSSVRFIDYIEDNHLGYEDYLALIRDKVDKHKYRIAIDGRDGGKAWLPHDGKAKNPQTKKSAIELLNQLGLKTDHEGVPNIGIKNRIEAGRQMFPRVMFDAEKCTPLFNRLRRYARTINLEDQATAIKKDGNDHAGDMYTYAAVIEKRLDNEVEDMEDIDYDNTGIV